MSNDDYDNEEEPGWFDNLQQYTWDSRTDEDYKNTHHVPEWDSFGNHGREGSHWHWELGANWREYQESREQGNEGGLDGDRFLSLSDANEVARYLAEHEDEWLPRIQGDTNGQGALGRIAVVWDEDDGAWRIDLDAYIEY